MTGNSLTGCVLAALYCACGLDVAVWARPIGQSSPPTRRSPPKPPRTPPPNKTRPGGGLSPHSQSCEPTADRLRALVPADNPVLTTSAHPTFLFYVPHGADEIRFGLFSVLLWPGETQRLVKIPFVLPQTPGIVSVNLPEVPAAALQEGQYYHWYFQLYCADNDGLQPDLEVNGWVLRVADPGTDSRPANPATAEIWYDKLSALARQRQAAPHDASLMAAWQALMQEIAAEGAAEAPIVGPIVILDE